MQNNHSNVSCASVARGFAALWAGLAMGLALMASPAAAEPFAYIANIDSNNVSVIDTATHPPSVVTTIPVGNAPNAVAVTRDGKHAYVANYSDNTVSVIRTATNTVVATVPVGNSPVGVAITPDGKHAYVSNVGSDTVSVIDTATKTVVATVAVGANPYGVAVTGTHAYVANYLDDTVSVIDTATNMVVATIPALNNPQGVAVTPDGKHVYVANNGSIDFVPGNTVSVIATATNTVVATVTLTDFFSFPTAVAITPDGTLAYVTNFGIFDGPGTTVSVIGTASNTVVATVPVGRFPNGVAVTPDGKHAYVANSSDGTVSVIRTATNMVVATVAVGTGTGPIAAGIVPPPPGVPFLAFSATALDIAFGAAPNEDSFNLHSQFTLSSTAPGIHPHREPVTLQVSTFSITIPPASFAKQPDGSFFFTGVINGVSLKARITPTATLQYAFHAKATGASLTGTKNKVYVTLIIGGDSGATSVTADISH